MEQLIYAGQLLSIRDRAAAELEDIDVLYAAYRSRIYRYALSSLRDPDLAENLTQDCFFRAYRSRKDFRGDCSASTWLIRIATNLIRDYTRSQKFQFWKAAALTALDANALADRLRSPELSPEASLIAKEKLKDLWSTVATLSGRQRSVFLLRFVEEMELPDIAVATGMNVGTVKSHLHRALTAVRLAMEKKR